MGLHGGGEESLTSGSSGWGTLPPMGNSSDWGGSSSTPNNTNANHWPNSRQIPNCDQTISTSPKPSSSWAQAAGKGLNNGPNGPNHDLNAFGNNGFQTNDNNSTKIIRNSDFGQINSEVKDTALISDNWGSTVINQDAPWALPPSPQSSPKECSSGSQWKSSTVSGTEIWENTVRHKTKGGPTPTPTNMSSAQPWGHHTPSTHIGGTWGEEEDPSNHWTGVPNANNGNNWSGNTNNMSNNTNNGNNNNPNMQWNHNNSDTNKDNSRQNSIENRPKLHPNTSWSDFNNEQTDSSGGSEPNWTETKSNESFGTWAPESTQKKGSNSSGWDDSNDNKGGNYDDGTAVWGNPVRQGKVNNWKETAAKQQQQQMTPNVNSIPNNSMPGMIASSPGMIRLPAGAPIGGKNSDNWGKPSQPPPQSIRGNSWSETSTHRDSPSNPGSLWSDSDNKSAQMASRAPNTPNWDTNSSPLAYWAAKPKATNSTNSNWSDGQIDTSSWGGPKQGKPLSRDIIWASKQFRILTDMGFKKDDVENALRNSSMKLEDAIIELKTSSARDSNSMDLEGLQRFKGSSAGAGMSSNTPSLLSTTSGIANSSLSSISRTPMGSVLPPPPHQTTAQNQSFTQANQVQSALGSNPNANRIGGSAQSNPIPNAAQLRVLVQQIQLAVQAGHLNAQILNQPLAPPTLQLLYQLLQQIKILHQLQISANQHLSKAGATNASGVPAIQSSINVQITQTKQRILNLQNQIAAQQALFLKEQHQSQQMVTQTPGAMNAGNNANTSTPMHSQQTSNNDFFKSSQTDNPSLVISNDRDLNSQSLSRFQTTWKPTFPKDDNKVNNIMANEFSRAPGPLPKQNNPMANWTGFGQSEESSGWPTDMTVNSISGAKANDLKEMSNSLSSSIQPSMTDAYNLNDLVPEFEPGKPWKGNSSLKNIEDDPTITPGSVNRSPLSINTIKDPLFNWPTKLSPGTPNSSADSLLSLSSSTWAFTPPSNSHIYNNSADINKQKNNMKSPSSWGALNPELQMNSCGDNLWGGGSVSKPNRGPPPGMTSQIKSPATTLPNSNANPTVSSAHNLWNADNRQTGSEFLLLRNLTPQIDGSTLKTLCLQHGPLQLFHLFLNHGIALTRYSTREEATKAQSALNNCVLGNTSILADIPQEAEVQQYLQLISGGGQQMASNPLNWSQNGQNNSSSNGVSQSSAGLYRSANSSLQFAGNSNSNPSKMDSSTTSPGWTPSGMSLWPFSNSGNNLWSAPSAQDRSTPSSIQSLLPGDLLGGETN